LQVVQAIGYGPSGGLNLVRVVIVILLILLLTGRLQEYPTMRYLRFHKQLALSTVGLAFIFGCEQKASKVQPSPPSATPSKVTLDDVNRDAAASLKTTAEYSQQEKDKVVADMKAKIEVMNESIESLRLKGKDLASDAKAKWDLKMATLDEKVKIANERLAEVGESTSKAWTDVKAGADSAWEELSKALQEASKEF
jgi:hypothetical protein